MWQCVFGCRSIISECQWINGSGPLVKHLLQPCIQLHTNVPHIHISQTHTYTSHTPHMSTFDSIHTPSRFKFSLELVIKERTVAS